MIFAVHLVSKIYECPFAGVRHQTDVLPVFNALRDAQKDISTVFSVDLACRLEPDESCPAAIIAEEAGYKLSLNGKTNVGLGKPRYKED